MIWWVGFVVYNVPYSPINAEDGDGGFEDEKLIGTLSSATQDIIGAVNMARYGIVNPRENGNVPVRWRRYVSCPTKCVTP